MKWLKHYNNCLNSESLADLIRENGFEGYGRYWALLEYLAALFDGESVSFRVPIENVRALLRIRSWNELDSFAERLSTVSGLDVKRSGNVYEIEAPILLNLQDRDFKKSRKASDDDAPKIKNKSKNKEQDKEKEIDISSEPSPSLPATVDKSPDCGCIDELKTPTTEILFATVKVKTQKAWLEAYPNAGWIIHEALKANVWVSANPHKAPKKFDRFFSNWLARAFEDYRKNLPSNRTGKNDPNENLRRQFENEGGQGEY